MKTCQRRKHLCNHQKNKIDITKKKLFFEITTPPKKG
jgi:hypothetical protein